MSKIPKNKRLSADEIADLAERGEDVSRYFTNTGKMKYPVKRVNVDFNILMLKELDNIAGELNISRQALIKTYLRQALDSHYLAREHRVQ
jgi:hypothetical protein